MKEKWGENFSEFQNKPKLREDSLESRALNDHFFDKNVQIWPEFF